MIRISAAHVDEIRRAAEAAYPEEACGLLIGRRDDDGGITVSRTAPSPNIADGDRKRKFEVSPQLRFDLMRELRDKPEEIVGLYHSHPDAPAAPSETDRERAWEPDLTWLIVAVNDGKGGEPRAWKPGRNGPEPAGFDEIPLATTG